MIVRDVFSIRHDGGIVADIPYTMETLRIVPTLIPRKPTLGDSLPSCYVQIGQEVTGCIVTRISPRNVAELLFLICGDVTAEGHEIGSRDLYFRDLSIGQSAFPVFSADFQMRSRIRQYPDLRVIGFILRGEYSNALELKIDLQGSREEIIRTQDNRSEILLDRFFFHHRSRVSLNEEELSDVIAFELGGNYDFEQVGEKRLSFRVRRWELNGTDFSPMRSPATFTLLCYCPWEYEEGFPARFEFSLVAVFQGEESFWDEREIRSREFRYLVSSFSCRCYLRGNMR